MKYHLPPKRHAPGEGMAYWKLNSSCQLCKRRIEWKETPEGRKPFHLTGERDTCYSKRPVKEGES